MLLAAAYYIHSSMKNVHNARAITGPTRAVLRGAYSSVGAILKAVTQFRPEATTVAVLRASLELFVFILLVGVHCGSAP